MIDGQTNIEALVFNSRMTDFFQLVMIHVLYILVFIVKVIIHFVCNLRFILYHNLPR